MKCYCSDTCDALEQQVLTHKIVALSSLVAPACSLVSCICLGTLLLVKSDQGGGFFVDYFFFFFKQEQDIIVRKLKSSSICQNKPKFVSESTLAYVRASERKKLIEK